MIDVLIIGAGPVGLTAALALSSLGKTVRIIDKKLDDSSQIRAVGLNPRSLMLLETMGLSDQLIANGIKVPTLNLLENNRVLIELNFAYIDCPYNFMLSLAQNAIEKTFIGELTKRGITIERETELISFKQNDNNVVATVKNQENNEEIECSYLYGADGAHSTVRQLSGISYEGENKIERWGIVDVEMDWPFPQSNIFMLDNSALLIVLPVSKDRYYAVSNREDTYSLLPKESKIHQLHWKTNFNVTFRLAKEYQLGRIFLGGDAAHIFPPIGGRGMNLGIEDAVIFAQLLVKNELSHYTRIQRHNAKQVLQDSEILVKVATLSTPAAKFTRDKIIVPILRNKFVQKHFCWRMTGLGNSVTASLLTSLTRFLLAW